MGLSPPVGWELREGRAGAVSVSSIFPALSSPEGDAREMFAE